MQKLDICRTDSTGCGLWNTKSWRSTSLERLLILPLPTCHNDFLQERKKKKASLMCLRRELPPHLKPWLPIPPSLLTLELAERGWPRNEPCPQAGVPDTTLLTRGLILCCVPGEKAAVLEQEKQGCKSDWEIFIKCMLLGRCGKVRYWNRNGHRLGGALVFNSGCMLDHREVLKNPNAQVAPIPFTSECLGGVVEVVRHQYLIKIPRWFQCAAKLGNHWNMLLPWTRLRYSVFSGLHWVLGGS